MTEMLYIIIRRLSIFINIYRLHIAVYGRDNNVTHLFLKLLYNDLFDMLL